VMDGEKVVRVPLGGTRTYENNDHARRARLACG
jgi:hypothetical protein